VRPNPYFRHGFFFFFYFFPLIFLFTFFPFFHVTTTFTVPLRSSLVARLQTELHLGKSQAPTVLKDTSTEQFFFFNTLVPYFHRLINNILRHGRISSGTRQLGQHTART
jgi:hypothetical protein